MDFNLGNSNNAAIIKQRQMQLLKQSYDYDDDYGDDDEYYDDTEYDEDEEGIVFDDEDDDEYYDNSVYDEDEDSEYYAEEEYEGTDGIVSVGNFLTSMLVTCIPIVNVILLVYWSFCADKKSKRNWAISQLIFVFTVIIIAVIICVFFMKSSSASMAYDLF